MLLLFCGFFFFLYICNGYHCIVGSNGDTKYSDARLLSSYNDPLGPGTQLSYYDAALKLGATMLYPGGLRHPGGTYANYWSYKNASYVSPCNSSYYNYCSEQKNIEQYPPQTFSPSNFSNGIATESILNATKHNAHSIVFDMNVYTLSGNEMLEQFNSINYNIFNNINANYYELGNELYIKNKYGNLIPNSTYYMEKVLPLINFIKQETNNNCKIAAIAFHETNDYNNEWNVGVAKYNESYDAVTIHDYSCGVRDVQNLSPNDQISYISIYGQSLIPQYVDYVHQLFGEYKKIWITEFNLGLNTNAFNATIQSSVVHAMFAISYITSAICHSNTMEFLMYHTWASTNDNAYHQLIHLRNEQNNDINDTTFGIMGQIYAHLSWISMIKNDQMHCLVVNDESSDNKCPNFHIAVRNKSDLQCVFGSAFSNSSDQNSFGFVLQNACSFDIPITFNLNGIANVDTDNVKLDKWTYLWNQIGQQYYTKFTDCSNNQYVWQCGPVTPMYNSSLIYKSEFTVNVTLASLSVILATTN